MLLTFVFVVSHNFEGSDRDPTNILHVNKNNVIVASSKSEEKEEKKNNNENSDPSTPVCWYKAQAETSCTYGGTIGMLLTGGLNLQIEHHLFPRISSWYYPLIQDDIRKCCERHNVTYSYYPTLFHNIVSMFKYVRSVGIASVLKEHAH